MKCTDCPYFWRDFDSRGHWTEDRPSCHFDADNRMPDDLPPCEQEDEDRRREADRAEAEWW